MTDIEKTLSKLGLTAYEIKVYLALLRHGTLGAVQLAKKSEVPFGRIYDILYQLELKGFIKVILGKPKGFAPLEPKMALEKALKKKTDELLELRDETKAELRNLETIYKETAEATKPSIWIVRGKENIEGERIRGFLELEKETVGIISPDVTTGVAPRVMREAIKAIKRGAKIRYIENPETKEVWEKVRAKVKEGQQIKLLPFKGFSFDILDSKRVRIEVPDKVYGRTSVLIENPNFAKAMKEYFEYKWKQAKPISSKRPNSYNQLSYI